MILDNEDKKVEIEVLLFECREWVSTCKHIHDRQNGPETKNHFVGRPYIHTLPTPYIFRHIETSYRRVNFNHHNIETHAQPEEPEPGSSVRIRIHIVEKFSIDTPS